jgi:cysteine sulfinate desulfinase/cysteine desulfurase-like protein
MGYANAYADRVLRFSSGWETTESDWMQLLEGVIQVSEELARVPGQPA